MLNLCELSFGEIVQFHLILFKAEIQLDEQTSNMHQFM